jgi:hypothetical protein
LSSRLKLKSAGCIALSDESETRADRNEINVQTLISSTIFAQTIASKVFEVYPPALLMRRVGCKIILRAGRTLADCSYVLSDFVGQIVYMMTIPRIVLIHGAAFGNGRHFTAKQKTKSPR